MIRACLGIRHRHGIEELKRRLELVIGAKPDAPVDDFIRREAEAEINSIEQKAWYI